MTRSNLPADRHSQSIRRSSGRRPALPAAEYVAPAEDAAGSAADSLDAVAYGRMLFRRKWTLVLITLAGIGAAIGLSLIQPRTYRAEAALEIQTPNEDFLNLGNISPTETTPSHLNESDIQTQAEILRQDWLLRKMLKRSKIGEHTDFVPKLGAWSQIQQAVGLPAAPLPPAQEYAVQSVKKNLKIVPSRQGRIVRIAYESTDPELSARVPNALAETFIEQSIEARWNAAQEIREWLRPQLQQLKGKLEQSEAELLTYSRAAGLLPVTGQESLAEDRLRLLQAEFAEAQADRIAKESRYRLSLTSQPEEIADSSVVREYRVRLTDLRRQLADLNTLLKPESYKIVRLKAQVTELEEALQKEIANSHKRLWDEYEASRKREALVADLFARQSQAVSQISSKMVRYNTLQRELETTRQFYETMMQRANEAGIALAIRPSSIRVVGPAEPPLAPHKPNVPLNLSLGAVAGLLLGIGFVTMREHTARRMRVPGDAEVYLSVPELGAIPSAKSLSTGPRRFLSAGQGSRSVELISWEQKFCDLSESFRAALVSILAVGRSGRLPRVMVVTSPLPMEGKTTVVSNLGIALSEIHHRVLLIDGDLRRPRLHRVFDVPNSWGLSNLLRERTGIEDLPLDTLVRRTNIPGLSVLPSGPGTDNIASLLYSGRMEGLMRRLRGEFDYVLIDAPPSLKFADARMLAHHADGVVFVVRANRTDDKTAVAAVQRLLMDGIPVLGTILNDWDPSAGEVYGYPGYGKLYYPEDNAA